MPLSEKKFFAPAVRIKHSLIIYMVSVAESMFHVPKELPSLHRTPPALALYHVFRYTPSFSAPHYCNVRFHSFAQKSAIAYLEQSRGGMTHQFGHALYCKHSLVNELQHRNQRELYHWHSGCRTSTTALFVVHGLCQQLLFCHR